MASAPELSLREGRIALGGLGGYLELNYFATS
jgi:hypothetical protein